MLTVYLKDVKGNFMVFNFNCYFNVYCNITSFIMHYWILGEIVGSVWKLSSVGAIRNSSPFCCIMRRMHYFKEATAILEIVSFRSMHGNCKTWAFQENVCPRGSQNHALDEGVVLTNLCNTTLLSGWCTFNLSYDLSGMLLRRECLVNFSLICHCKDCRLVWTSVWLD